MNGLKYLGGRQKDWLINWIRLMEWQNHVLLGIFFLWKSILDTEREL